MTYDGDDEYTLSSGRTVYAHGGVVGICPCDERDDDQVSQGWDGVIDYDAESDSPWTAEERREFADAMIARWTRWRDAAL